MGKSKTVKTENAPWAQAQPYLLGAANDLQGQYGQTSGVLNQDAGMLNQLLPGQIDRFTQGTPLTNAGENYLTDTLGGKYLDKGNPYLQGIVDNTNNDVRNQVQAAMGTQGLTGGSDYARMIAKELAKNETNLRYGDYSNERGYQQQAAGMIPGQIAGQNALLDPALNIYAAQSAPMNAASQYANSIGGLFSPYGSQTQKQSGGGLLGTIGGIGSTLFGLGSLGGFKGIGKTIGKAF